MKLPLLISVPHAGDQVPPEVNDICILTYRELVADGDEGAQEIYFPLKEHVQTFTTTPIARAIVDLNRAQDDIGGDGVIKTHTCLNIPVYKTFPTKKQQQALLKSYYIPYHKRLSKAASSQKLTLGIDCHTMLEIGPPIGPDAGEKRPLICLSNASGTCPQEWIEKLAAIMKTVFPMDVSINKPFQGGFITQNHGAEMPWLQLEISRTKALSDKEKAKGIFSALKILCQDGLLLPGQK